MAELENGLDGPLRVDGGHFIESAVWILRFFSKAVRAVRLTMRKRKALPPKKNKENERSATASLAPLTAERERNDSVRQKMARSRVVRVWACVCVSMWGEGRGLYAIVPYVVLLRESERDGLLFLWHGGGAAFVI